ncbi:MAG: hypothetical protein HYU41_01605 [Candidatus Rokubacteria bacterium]|nr:hypothetical protein [Candidatus Rokubacteria bacterium]
MATTGKLGITTFTTPSDRELLATRAVDAPRRLAWEMWTNPKHVPHWMTGPDGWPKSYDRLDEYLRSITR